MKKNITLVLVALLLTACGSENPNTAKVNDAQAATFAKALREIISGIEFDLSEGAKSLSLSNGGAFCGVVDSDDISATGSATVYAEANTFFNSNIDVLIKNESCTAASISTTFNNIHGKLTGRFDVDVDQGTMIISETWTLNYVGTLSVSGNGVEKEGDCDVALYFGKGISSADQDIVSGTVCGVSVNLDII